MAAQVSLNGEAWKALLPVDGVADSDEERFEYTVGDDRSASHALRVRITDAAGNQGGAMWSVPAP